MYYPHLKTAHQSFCVFRLLAQAPLIRGTGSGLLPTPTATEISNTAITVKAALGGLQLNQRKKANGNSGQVSLTDFLMFLALTDPSDQVTQISTGMPPSMLSRLRGSLPVVRINPKTGKPQYPDGKPGQLNPRFVAEMMGFPVNWTELPFLGGEKTV
ncbi:hypothetical protein HDC92_004334 [Pedobacter sp. AK017]|uniref:hypothetical protein n=1 Tax=Pedobacter sp. AK017 TaxID=2723073 RepID=UPI0017924AAE|nr:hypothetical protein [Pedobacter sp. AK017]MBB5440631.1 hypothetical protein [Pedobacter sp. AK017]